MGYRDIIKGIDSSKQEAKEKLVPVFSDIVGKSDSDGLLAQFVEYTEDNLKPTNDFYYKIYANILNNNDLENALRVYESQFNSRKKWITLMGLLERKIFQYRCLRKPNIAISIQEQKSGENKFKYILARAQFVTLFEGKKELRVYLKKLEDYPGYNTLEELKNSDNFIQSAYESIRDEMKQIMSKESIELDYIIKELKSIDPYSEVQLAIQFEDDAKKKADDTRRSEYLKRNEKMMSQFNEEQIVEIELNKSNIKKFRNSPNELKNEKQRHKEVMDRLRLEKNQKKK
jgi:hypothetical protein